MSFLPTSVKNDVAARARKEREARQEQRRKESAGQTILSIWKRYARRRQCLSLALAAWDIQTGFLFDEHISNNPAAISTSLTARQLLQLFKRLILLRSRYTHTINEKIDQARVAHIARMWMSPSTDIGSIVDNLSTLYWTVNTMADVWAYIVNLICADTYTTGIELRFLIHTFDFKNWLNKTTPSTTTKRRKGCGDTHLALISRGVFTILGKALLHHVLDVQQHHETNSSLRLWITTVVRLVTFSLISVDDCMYTKSVQRTLIAQVTIHLLSAPSLLIIAGSPASDMLRKSNYLKRAIDCIVGNKQVFQSVVKQVNKESLLFLIVNLIHLYRSSHSPSDIFLDLIKSLCLLLQYCTVFMTDEPISPSPRSISKNLIFHPILHWCPRTDVSVFTHGTHSILYKQTIDQLEYLWSKQFIAQVFQCMTRLMDVEPRLVQNDLSQNLLAVVDAIHASELYSRLRQVVKSCTTEITTSIAFHLNLVAAQYRFLAHVGKKTPFLTFLNAVTTPDQEPLMPVLELFCETCSVLLLTVTDAELFEKEQPLTPSQLADFARFLENFLFKLYLNGTQKQVHSLVSAARQLFHQLYDRHNRRALDSKLELVLSETSTKEFRRRVLEDREACAMAVLANIPQCVPFALRVQVFQEMVGADRHSRGNEFYVIEVRRGSYLLEDGYTALNRLSGQQFRKPIKVKFVNQLGLKEAGIDQNGVFKEFLEDIMRAALNLDLGLFAATGKGTLIPSVSSLLHPNHLAIFEFVGKVLGKALYEGIVVDVPFPVFFWGKLLGRYSMLDDLSEIDDVLYKNLDFLKHYEGNVKDLCLTFTYEERLLDRVIEREIRPGGAAVPVTNDNRIQYIYLVANYRLNRSIKEQSEAFVAGVTYAEYSFHSVIPVNWLSIFSPPELQRLICGDDIDINLADLRQHTQYQGGYFDTHRVITYFWSVLADLNIVERRQFLKFCTSCSKPPIQGFKLLDPPFTIRYVPVDDDDTGSSPISLYGSSRIVKSLLGSFIRFGNDTQRLPSSSTCFNLLKLPAYKHRSTLRDRLKYAITSASGFELS